MDRFDLRIEVPPVAFSDLNIPDTGDSSPTIAARIQKARDVQTQRFEGIKGHRVNADAEGNILEEIATPEPAGLELLLKVAERMGLSARGYHRVLRVARTIADLEGCKTIQRNHIAEAISFRLVQSDRITAEKPRKAS